MQLYAYWNKVSILTEIKKINVGEKPENEEEMGSNFKVCKDDKTLWNEQGHFELLDRSLWITL